MKRVLGFFAALCALAAPAYAEEAAPPTQRDLAMVWFTSHACPEAPAEGLGATPENPIEVENFSDLYNQAFPSGPDIDPAPAAPSPHECKWVRVRGFARWMNYYDYRATLVSEASNTYFGGGPASYIIESFADPNARRADIAQRDVTIVGRFYDLCAAARREQQASNQFWMTFGPCHYGEDRGLMLRDVRVAAIHDAAPRYVLGQRSSDFFRHYQPVHDETRASALEATRNWAATAQRGSESLAEAVIAAAATRNWTDEDKARVRREYADPDSYISYVATHPEFLRINAGRAQVEVFREAEGGGDAAHGCICLVTSCDDAWPIFRQDADTFLGDAVCTQLLLRDGVWEWD